MDMMSGVRTMNGSIIKSIGVAVITAASFSSLPAHALLVEGITYTLNMTSSADPLTNLFTLDITGINGASDTKDGRYGVESLAFAKPANYVSAVMTAPAGYVTMPGGLNANGCSGSGDFFCFDGLTPVAPALSADSSLSFNFSVMLSSGSFASYMPEFKINWVGTERNYSNVGQVLSPMPPQQVPEPMTLSLLGLGLLAIPFARRQRV
jgi:hypothetical protein